MFRAIRRILIAALLVASAAATPPTAYAMINERHSPAPSTESGTALTQVRVAEASSSGFDWGDAGIGAAVTVVLMGAGAATLAGRRRTRTARRMARAASGQATGSLS